VNCVDVSACGGRSDPDAEDLGTPRRGAGQRRRSSGRRGGVRRAELGARRRRSSRPLGGGRHRG
jgi:hypothetical protein